MATDNTQALRDDPSRHRDILARIPAARWGTPDDLQGAVVFLASQILSGDTHRLGENGVSDRRKDRIAQHDIHARDVEHFFEAKTKGDELKKCQCVRDIHENINVTVRTCTVASGRPEQRDLFDSKIAPQLVAMLHQEGENLVACVHTNTF